MPDAYFTVVLVLGAVFGGGGLAVGLIGSRIQSRHLRRAERSNRSRTAD